MDFSRYVDFYVVISVLGPPEAVTSRFLFHVTLLTACGYQKGESEKGESGEGTTQSLPSTCEALLSQALLKALKSDSATFTHGLGKAAARILMSLPPVLK